MNSDYEIWFREQVSKAVQEADDPATVWIPHDVAKADMQQQRERLLTRLAPFVINFEECKTVECIENNNS